MTDATAYAQPANGSPAPFSVIDADVHNYPNSIADLRPFLSSRWQAYADQSGLKLPGVSLYPKVFAAEQWLDRWAIERATLNPLVAASALHNHDLGNAIALAVNEWTASAMARCRSTLARVYCR